MQINDSVYSHPTSDASLTLKYENIVSQDFSHDPSALDPPDAGNAKIDATLFSLNQWS
jgi:hypothetical protein